MSSLDFNCFMHHAISMAIVSDGHASIPTPKAGNCDSETGISSLQLNEESPRTCTSHLNMNVNLYDHMNIAHHRSDSSYSYNQSHLRLTEEIEKETTPVNFPNSTEFDQSLTKKGTVRKRRKYKLSLKERKKEKFLKTVEKHQLKTGCNCKLKTCGSKISDDQRCDINSKFWALSSSEQQIFVTSHVSQMKVKRRRGETKSRSRSLKYFLKDEKGESQQVCKTFFLTTLGFNPTNDRIVATALRKSQNSGDLFTADSKTNKDENAKQKTDKNCTAENAGPISSAVFRNSGNLECASLSKDQSCPRLTEGNENEASTDIPAELDLSLTKKGTVRKRKKYKLSLKERKKDQFLKTVTKHQLKTSCNCKLKTCNSRISHDQRCVINRKFWTLTSSERQVFVSSLISQTTVKRRRGETENRNRSLKYNLKDEKGETQQVCKTFFLTTLGFNPRNDRIVATALRKSQNSGEISTADNRGDSAKRRKNKDCIAGNLRPKIVRKSRTRGDCVAATNKGSQPSSIPASSSGSGGKD